MLLSINEKERQIRLRNMDLFSTSEVLWGGNDAGKKIMGGAQNLL